jgi:hypothetical protein
MPSGRCSRICSRPSYLFRAKFWGAALAAATAALTAGSDARAAIAYPNSGVPYVQNFNQFAGAAGNVPFTNDVTMTGVYAYLSGAGATATAGPPDVIYRNSTTASATTATASFAIGTSYPFYFYRPAAADTNVSFGLFNSDNNSSGVGTGYVAVGFALRNDTGKVQTSFQLAYTPAASAVATTNTDTVSVSYAINAAGVADGDGTYTTVPALGYSTSAAGVLTGPTDTLATGLTINPNDVLFIRFKDVNVGGVDRFSRIDDVVISVPEPGTAAVGGLAAWGLAALRRRRPTSR